MEHPSIHDNFVYALAVDLERRLLVLHTEYRDGNGPHELTDVRFRGVIAHYFQDVAGTSILFDIEEASADWVVREWSEQFERRKNHGWPPIEYTDLADLSRKLTEQHVFGYLVRSSYGLGGFVLA